MKRRWFGIVALAALVALTGCAEKLHDGAIDIFSKTNICPADRLVAKERKDIQPHTILDVSVPAPPPEVAADPGRMQMWRDMHRVPDVDAFARVFEVTGCGKTTKMACAHPRIDEADNDFSASVSKDQNGVGTLTLYTESSSSTSALVVESDVVKSAVVCLPEGTRLSH